MQVNLYIFKKNTLFVHGLTIRVQTRNAIKEPHMHGITMLQLFTCIPMAPLQHHNVIIEVKIASQNNTPKA